jgi:hypothetical protein
MNMVEYKTHKISATLKAPQSPQSFSNDFLEIESDSRWRWYATLSDGDMHNVHHSALQVWVGSLPEHF